jgi:hypothetical protein
MTDAVLLATFLANVLGAFVYAYVGLRLYGRPVSPAARLAVAQFSVWWLGLGVSSALGAFEALLAYAGLLSLAAAFTLLLLVVLLDVVLLWGLVGFLVYVYTGRYHLLELGIFYAAFYVAALYYEILSAPYAVTVVAGVPTLSVLKVSNPILVGFVIIGLIVPELAAAIFYVSLLRRTRDRIQRYRIALVSSSLFLWFAVNVFVPTSTGTWTVAKDLLNVVPALLALIAYFPPESIRRRLRWTASAAEEVGGLRRAAPRPEE